MREEIMFRNYLKIALRNILKNKAFSFINITGLAIGMACCVLILLFVQDELTYDSYHEKADRIYRLIALNKSAGEERYLAPIGAPIAEIFERTLPEVQKAVRINRGNRVLVEYQDNRYFEERLYYGDPTMFDVFDFPIIRGDPRSALSAPFEVVITETIAKKYFGDVDPVGKNITIDKNNAYNIAAVMKDVPSNSHFHFDFLVSMETLASLHGERYLKHPGNMAYYTYLLLEENTEPKELERKMAEGVRQSYGEKIAAMRTFLLQPLKSIHLQSRLEYEIEANGSISFVYTYSAIALCILLIAAFNFVNLSTARSTKRAREVGMRKVLGAFRYQLVKQFLGETILFAVISLFLAVILVRLFLPIFNSFTGKQFPLNFLANPSVLLGFVGIVIVVGVLGGLYPAVFLSAFEPMRTLKGKLGTGGRSRSFRRFLVVAQFTISIVLIIGTFVIRNQLRYMRNQNLGFSKEQVVVMPMHDQNTRDAYEYIKTEFMNNPSVLSVSASSTVPGKSVINIAYRLEGLPDDDYFSMDTFFVDYDFLDTIGIEIAEGRGFSKEFGTDEESAFLFNEAAVRELNWQSALNKQIIWPSDLRRLDAIVKKGQVVGVVKDFHVASLHETIGPVLFQVRPSSFRYISARIAPVNIPDTLSFFREKWGQLSPVFPFEYTFLDEDFDKLYRADEKVGRIVGVFSVLAIIVACFGLFGLASFAAEQRTKEIGIRKVLGASVSGIIILLSHEFTKWVLIANLIAWPIAYFSMSRWLQNFAYKMSLSTWIFALSGFLAFAIALATVSYQSIKAAISDPIDSLRYE
jgi:putative ABC transport system permease protein